MARKTKKVNNSNESVSQLSVGGNVSIDIKQGKRIVKTLSVHNSPTINLFMGIMLALSSFEYAQIQSYLPRFLCAGTGTYSESDVSKTGLAEPIAMNMVSVERINSPRIESESNKGVVKFQAVIPYSSIGSSVRIKELGLYGESSSNNNSMVARVQLPNDIILEQGQSLYIQ